MKITEFKVVVASSSDVNDINVEDLACEVIIPQCYKWLKKNGDGEESDFAVDCRMVDEKTTKWVKHDEEGGSGED